jgi:hypothetical protein
LVTTHQCIIFCCPIWKRQQYFRCKSYKLVCSEIL